jgi:hypothetical protein
MSFLLDKNGDPHQVQLQVSDLQEAHTKGVSLKQLYNLRYASEANVKFGTPWEQLKRSCGFAAREDFGVYSPSVAKLLDGSLAMQMASGQSAGSAPVSSVYGGTESRLLFAPVLIEMAEATLQKNLEEDATIFTSMLALDMPVAGSNFEQVIINYQTANGAQGPDRARLQRVAQWAEPPVVARLSTSDKVRKIPTYAYGLETTLDAQRALTIDLMALTLSRLLAQHQSDLVYQHLSDLFVGDADVNVGAIAAVTSTSLDAAATGGVMTWNAWIKWLRRSKVRRITDAVCDIDTWTKIMKASGRPGASQAQDTRVSVPDTPSTIANAYFGENVRFFITDAAADGGPVPANTVWGLDRRNAIVRARNTEAEYRATEQFAMRKTEATRIDTSWMVYRNYDQAFDVLTIA